MGIDQSGKSGSFLRSRVLQAQDELVAVGARLRDYRVLLAKCRAQKLPDAEIRRAVSHAEGAYRAAHRLYTLAVKELAHLDAQKIANIRAATTKATKADPPNSAHKIRH